MFEIPNGFTRDIIKVVTQHEEAVLSFRGYLEGFSAEDQPRALHATVAQSFAENFVEDTPWLQKQLIGRALFEHVDWKAVLRALNEYESRSRYSLN